MENGEYVARLLLQTDSRHYKLDKFHDVYKIECKAGVAVDFARDDLWYAIGLEFNGKLITPSKRETCQMKVFDERDPEHGAVMLMSRTSAPWKDGLYYFKALEWRQVGQYRVTFKVQHPRNDLKVIPLTFYIRVTDPLWEAEMLQKMEEELEEQLARQKEEEEAAMGYPFAPLTKKEIEWLSAHESRMGKDPAPQALQILAVDMQQALKTPSTKDVSIIAQRFESDAARVKRLAAEKQSKEVWKRQRVLQTQRLLLADRAHPTAPLHSLASTAVQADPRFLEKPGRDRKPTVSSTALSRPLGTVLSDRKHQRKPSKPLHIATTKTFSDARNILDRWTAAAEEDERLALQAVSSGGDAKVLPRRSAAMITDSTWRLYRHDALAAGQTHVLWDIHSAAHAVLVEWMSTSSDMLERALRIAESEMFELFREHHKASNKTAGIPVARKLAALKASLSAAGTAPKRAKSDEGVEDISVEDAIRYPLDDNESFTLLLRCLDKVQTSSVPGWMQLTRYLKALPERSLTDAPATAVGAKRKRSAGGSGR